MQNKKKSKKVQAFVQSVAKQVKDNVDRHFDTAKSAEAKRAEELRKQKAQQAAIEKEMGSLPTVCSCFCCQHSSSSLHRRAAVLAASTLLVARASQIVVRIP